MRTETPTISRSPGLPITIGGLPTGYLAGGGYSGASSELDLTVQDAAELLRESYGMDVTIRFNSDRMSGGAWLVTDEGDGFGGNAEIGICATLVDARSVNRAVRSVEEHRRAAAKLQRQIDTLPGDSDTFLTDVANLQDRLLACEECVRFSEQDLAWTETHLGVTVQAHVGARALADKSLANSYVGDPVRGYYHGNADTLTDALSFVRVHGDLDRVAQWQALAGVAKFLVAGGEAMLTAKPTRRRAR